MDVQSDLNSGERLRWEVVVRMAHAASGTHKELLLGVQDVEPHPGRLWDRYGLSVFPRLISAVRITASAISRSGLRF
jgi:hypothetical protein